MYVVEVDGWVLNQRPIIKMSTQRHAVPVHQMEGHDNKNVNQHALPQGHMS